MDELTMPRCRGIRRAFSLVELMIVIAVLAILAALVVPRYTSATERARENGLQRQLQTVRGQLEHYRQQEGAYPPSVVAGTDWSDLVDRRYIVTAPKNAFQEDSVAVAAGDTIAAGDAAPADSAWYFDTTLNVLYAVDESGNIYDF
ncbi:MAG: competence type IV pilus major pilin ComGC [Phycisphaerales bacterium]